MKTRFENRSEAGRLLAQGLSHHAQDPSVLVLGLARGGVPVAYEVAKRLKAPLDVFVVRTLGAPGNEELATLLNSISVPHFESIEELDSLLEAAFGN